MLAPIVLAAIPTVWVLAETIVSLNTAGHENWPLLKKTTELVRHEFRAWTSENPISVARFLDHTFHGRDQIAGRSGSFDPKQLQAIATWRATHGATPTGAQQVQEALRKDAAVNCLLLGAVTGNTSLETLDPHEDDDMAQYWTGSGFLVGGPMANPSAREHLDRIQKAGSYLGFAEEHPDQPIVTPEETPYMPKKDGAGRYTLDHGLLIRIPNWRDKDQRVVLAMGPTRYGTRAAAAPIVQPGLAKDDIIKELDRKHKDESFYAVITGSLQDGTLVQTKLVEDARLSL
jgi:hypothetical protein